MKKTLLLLAAFMAVLLGKAQPTDVPAVSTTDNVYLLYANGGQNGFNFYDWGGGTGAAVDVNGTQVYQISGFKFFGSGFNKVDVSNKKFFHIDVYPTQEMTLGAVMICRNEQDNGNEGEKGVNLPTLKPNQWNAIDIPVQDYIDGGAVLTRLFQIKLVGSVVAHAAGVNASDGFANGDGTATFYIGNEYFYGTRVTDTTAPVLVTAEATTVNGNDVTLTLNATDDNAPITYTITDAANNQTYTATGTAGTTTTKTITGLEGLTTYNWTVQATDIGGNKSNTIQLSFTTKEGFKITAAPAPTVDASKVKAIFSDAYTPATTYNIGGWGQSTTYETTAVSGDNVIHLKNFNYIGLEFASDVDLANMNYLHVDVLPRQAMTMGITPIMRGGSPTENPTSLGTLTPNQWNSIDIPLSKIGLDFANYAAFQLKLDKGAGSDEVYVDNIYFYNNGQGNFFVETANGVATVGGDLTADNVAQVNDADAMFIDLTGVASVAEGVTLSPKHKNALIAVTGTHDGTNVAAAKYAALAGTPNMVVQDTWLFPVTQVQITDDPTEPQWMGERNVNQDVKFISTGSTGYKVSRVIPAKTFVTTYTTAAVNIADLPAGLTAWEATTYDGTTVTFAKAGTIAAFFPYVLYNANDTEVTFSFAGTGDFNLYGWATDNVAAHAVGSAYFQGNLANKMTDGSQWILQDATGTGNAAESVVFKKANGATITAFRAYFTGLTATAAAKFNGLDTATAIDAIDAPGTESGKVYSINGMEMKPGQRLPKGIYIVKGKKYIVK